MVLMRHQRGWIIALTFVVALLLAMIPLPNWLDLLRPEWPAMVLIYWCLAAPQRVNVGTGWTLGLLLDVLRGTVLGQYALGMAVMAYFTVKLHRQIRIFPLWQQALSVMVFMALLQLLVTWTLSMMGQPRYGWTYWMPVLTTALLWPWMFLLLRTIRRRFRVS